MMGIMDEAPDDPIAALGEQWRAALPDLDTAPMLLIARLNRTRAVVMARIETMLVEAGSSLADFDVLSTLRRQAPPHRMKPSAIAEAVMLSASGMTNRIDHLVDAGLVERVPDPTNRRVLPVQLTERGLAEAEWLVRLLVTDEANIVAGLDTAERSRLASTLAELERSARAAS